MELEIQTRQIELDPAWRDMIEEVAARLCERHPRMLRMHVTLTHSHHHRHGMDEAAIVANLPRVALRVAKEEENMPDAIRAAVEAFESEIDRRDRTRRRIARPRPRTPDAPRPAAEASVAAVARNGT